MSQVARTQRNIPQPRSDNRKEVACNFFQQGMCKNGTECPFRHVLLHQNVRLRCTLAHCLAPVEASLCLAMLIADTHPPIAHHGRAVLATCACSQIVQVYSLAAS